MKPTTFALETTKGVATITLDRPKRLNALTFEVYKELGPIWRARMGSHYPAMALVAVTALVEPEALVEIQAVAYLEHSP